MSLKIQVEKLTVAGTAENIEKKLLVCLAVESEEKKTEIKQIENLAINWSESLEFNITNQENINIKLFEEGQTIEIGQENLSIKEYIEKQGQQEQIITVKQENIEYNITIQVEYIKQTQQNDKEEVEEKTENPEQNSEQNKQQQEEQNSEQKQEDQKPIQSNQQINENQQKINYKINNNQTHHKLIIEGIRCYLQKASNHIGDVTYNTYCVIQVGETTQQTKVLFNTNDRPEFSEVFEFYIQNEKQINISIYDQLAGKKTKLICNSFINTDQFLKNSALHQKGAKGECILEKGDKKDIIGHLYFDIHSLPPNTNLNNVQDNKKKKKLQPQKKNTNKNQNKKNDGQDDQNVTPEQYDQMMTEGQDSNLQNSMRFNESILSKQTNKSMVYGLGVSTFQSASSLQHSIPSVGFSKAKRFSQNLSSTSMPATTKANPSHLPSIFDKNYSTFNQRGAGIGYGQKRLLPVYMEINAKVNPSPSQYFQKQSSLGQLQGHKQCTFGVSREANNKLYMPDSKLVNINIAKDYPSPNQYYEAYDYTKKAKYAHKMQFRIPPIKDDSFFTPSPLQYKSEVQPEKKGKGIGFGYSQRKTFQNTISPGPAQYSLPSAFQKFQKKVQTMPSSKNLNTQQE